MQPWKPVYIQISPSCKSPHRVFTAPSLPAGPFPETVCWWIWYESHCLLTPYSSSLHTACLGGESNGTEISRAQDSLGHWTFPCPQKAVRSSHGVAEELILASCTVRLVCPKLFFADLFTQGHKHVSVTAPHFPKSATPSTDTSQVSHIRLIFFFPSFLKEVIFPKDYTIVLVSITHLLKCRHHSNKDLDLHTHYKMGRAKEELETFILTTLFRN